MLSEGTSESQNPSAILFNDVISPLASNPTNVHLSPSPQNPHSLFYGFMAILTTHTHTQKPSIHKRENMQY